MSCLLVYLREYFILLLKIIYLIYGSRMLRERSMVLQIGIVGVSMQNNVGYFGTTELKLHVANEFVRSK